MNEISYTTLKYFCSGSSTTGKPVGAYCDVLAQCEVTRVLLLMLLQVTRSLRFVCHNLYVCIERIHVNLSLGLVLYLANWCCHLLKIKSNQINFYCSYKVKSFFLTHVGSSFERTIVCTWYKFMCKILSFNTCFCLSDCI